MPNKYRYTGERPDIYAEGFAAGVEAGEAMASAKGDLTDNDIKKLNSGSASALTDEQRQDLDAKFGLLKPSGAVVVRGAIQTFGELTSTVPAK